MKNIFLIFVFFLLASCNSQKKFSDFDYSYARSGGKMAVYENLLIKGNVAHYLFEDPKTQFQKDFKVSQDDINALENALSSNNFRSIQEDYKKVYDNVSTLIRIKKGENSGSKSDAGFIMERDKKRWMNVKTAFEQIINSNIKKESVSK